MKNFVPILLSATLMADSGGFMKEMEHYAAPAPDSKEKTELRKEHAKGSALQGTVYIKGVKFTGNTKVDTSLLEKMSREQVQKSVSAYEIATFVKEVEKLYYDKGFPVVAIVPRYEDGLLEYIIVEAIYDTIAIHNESSVKDEHLKKYFERHKEGTIIDKTLVETMELVKNLGGVSHVSGGLSSGSKFKSTRVDATVLPSKRVTGHILFDNHGGYYTGNVRGRASLYWDNPTGRGDRFNTTFLVSDNTLLKYGQLNYSRPLGYSGLEWHASYSKSAYKIGEDLKPKEYKGESDKYSLGLVYPLKMGLHNKAFVEAKYNHNQMEDSVKGIKYADYSINSLEMSLRGASENVWGDGLLSTSGSLTYTTGSISRKLPGFPNGNYSKINLDGDVSYSQKGYTAGMTVQLQKALTSNDLPSTETISIGGASGVRAYDYGKASADSGLLTKFYLNKWLPPLGDSNHRLELFYEYGTLRSNSGDTDSRGYHDIGVEHLMRWGKFYLRHSVAYALGSELIQSKATNSNRCRYLFQGGVIF